MEKIKLLAAKLGQFFGSIFTVLFGEVNYQSPKWWRKISEGLRSFRQNKPQVWKAIWRSALGIIAIGVVSAASYFGYKYFRPLPEFVTFTVTKPAFPDLEKPKPEAMTLDFSHPVARVDIVGKEETEYISISPKVSGKWSWTNDKQLQFIPEASEKNPYGWPIGFEFEVKVKDRFFPKGLELKEAEAKFSTTGLTVNQYNKELYRDPMAPKIQRATGTFSFNYPVDVEDIRRRISAKLSEKQAKLPQSHGLKIATTFNEWKTEVYVTTENIPVPEANSVVEIKLEKGGLGLWGGEAGDLSFSIDMPGRNSLKVLSSQIQNVRNDNFEPEQALVIETSLPISGKKLAEAVEVYLLPKRKKNRQWTSATELDQKIMADAETIKPEIHPTETEESASQSFKVKLPQNRQLLVKVKKGLTNAAEYFMPFEYQDVVNVGTSPKEILIMGSGTLLSLSGEKKIPLLSRNVTEIKAELYRLLPEQLTQMSRTALNSGSFQKPYFPTNVLWDTTQKVEKVISVGGDSKTDQAAALDPNETHYSSLNMDQILKPGRKGLYYIKLSENKKNKSSDYEYEDDYSYGMDGGEGKDQRLILMTDLGLIVKKNFSKTYTVFVQNLRTGLPVGGAKIEVLGRNGLSILDVRSSEDGTAEVPNLSSFKKEQTPTLFIASLGEDFVFMPVDLYERQLDYSKFDVGGIYESTDSDQLIGYMFSDRGIYRPGEEINIGYIIRNRLMSKISKDVPLEMSILAPDGTIVEKKMIRINTDDIGDFKWKSQDESPTGVYRFSLSVPDPKKGNILVGEVNVRVEEFAPDELSIFAHYGVDSSQGWLMNPSEEMKLSVKNLFGTPASDRQIETKLTVTTAQPYFRKYSAYRFSFNNKNNYGMDQSLPSGLTDVAGEFKQVVDLTKLNEGFYQVRLDSQAMQAGSGRSVYSRAISYFSTVPYVVGFKTESDISYLKENAEHHFDLLAIDSKLEKTELKKVKFQLSQIQYVSTLLKQPNGLFKYQSIKKDKVLKTEDIDLVAGDNKYKIPTDLRGDFYYTLTDSQNRELTRIDFSVIGDGEQQRGFDKSSELKLTLNRKDYSPEAEIEIELRAPFAGSGLITIEREKVYASKWFKSTSATSVQKIKIPAGVEGYAYVNVSWLRSVDSKQIYMNPLSYAVESFSVSLDSRKNKLTLEVPELVKPGSTLNISYSANSPTPIILYGVNEGILQVAQYSNPNAVDFFFKRRALQVTTFQLLDLLRPEFSIVKAMSGTGGDMEAGGGGMNLNPFKRKTDPPVVFWSGRLQADVTKKVFAYKVPDYFNGSMRIIAMAANQKMFGQTVDQVTVRGDLILTPSVPYFVAPGDEFESAVIVANQKRGSGDKAEIVININSDKFESNGTGEARLTIPEGQEKTQFFMLKSKDVLGATDIKFKAELSGTVVERTMSVSIRPPQVFQTTFFTESVGKESILKNDRDVYSEYAQANAALSELPFSFVSAAEIFLTTYEYSCSEQLLSRALGYVAMEQLGLTPAKKTKKIDYKAELTKMIDVLKTRQNGDGGLALYPRSYSEPSLVPMAFLLNEQLKAVNLSLPAMIVDGLTKSVIDIPISETSSEFQLRNAARSLYWLTKQGKLVTNKVEYLDKITQESKDVVLKAYLAASYDQLKMQSEASKVWRKVELNKKPLWSPEDFMSQASSNSEILFLAAKHNKEKVADWVKQPDFKDSFSELYKGQIQTQSASMSLIAAVSVLTMNENKTVFSVGEETAPFQYKNFDLTGKLIKRAIFSPLAKSIKVTTNADIYTTVAVGGFDKKGNLKEQINGLEATRAYLVGDKEVTKAKLGEEVTVRMRFKATGGKSVPHVVWIDLLPGGLEPKLESVVFGDEDIRSNEGSEGEGDYEEEAPPIEEEGSLERSRVEMFARQLISLPKAYAQTPAAVVHLPRYYPRYVDRREDRIVIYGSIAGETVEYTYKAKAASVGKFVIPAFYGENMYDRQVFYKGVEGQFEVYK